MALRFCDGCDSYAVNADLAKKWAAVGTGWGFASGGGRFGGGAITVTGNAGSLLVTKAGLTASAEQVFAFYIKISAPPASLTTFLGGVTPGGGVMYGLRLNTNGTLALYDQNNNSLSLTSTINICDNNWHWVEVRGSNASRESMYIDNIFQVSTTNNGTNSAIDHYEFLAVATITITLDDIIFYDDATGAPQQQTNFPLNARQIIVTRPTSDGTCTFSTLSAGTSHFSLINETAPDGDATYVQDGTSGDQDLLNMGALGATPASITCVMENLYVDNPTGGSININGVCKSSATTSLGTAVVTPLIYQTLQFPFPTDPNTAAAWAVAGLNAAQFGYKVP
jgi:hypothetical protein